MFLFSVQVDLVMSVLKGQVLWPNITPHPVKYIKEESDVPNADPNIWFLRCLDL